jgi:hypothetical protein
VRIVGACKGNRFVSIGRPPVSFDSLADGNRGRLERLRVTLPLIGTNVALQFRYRLRGIRIKCIFGTTWKTNEVSPAIYRDFLPDALASGRYLAAPKPSIVGSGIQDIPGAMAFNSRVSRPRRSSSRSCSGVVATLSPRPSLGRTDQPASDA